jgi:3-oxoacyl-[acyl-carrier-protein] synthase-3
MPKSSSHTHILGLGHYVPEPVLSNRDMEQMVETTDEWITIRTGIKERRIARGMACSDLALEASRRALAEATVDPRELTHILVATFTPDYNNPATACVLQDKLGAVNCGMAMDLSAGCSGFIYGLEAVRGLTMLDPKATILLVGSEVCTSRLNFRDRNTCVLFGDGAGATVISGSGGNNPSVLDSLLKSEGSMGHLLPVGREGGSYAPFELGQTVSEDYFIQMNGRELFRLGVRGMADLCSQILARNGLSTNDVDLFIPHQANLRIIEAVAKKMQFPMERVYVNVDRFGNTSAASVILALSEARADGRIDEGTTVLMVAFGAGLTLGACLVQF